MLRIISQIELSSFYFKLTKKSMFPVLYDGAGPPVYGACFPNFRTPFAEGIRPSGGRNCRGRAAIAARLS
jgi:hypothetical protein